MAIAKIKEARNTLAQYHADRLNDSLIDIAGILTARMGVKEWMR